jgi:D-alanyl-lipoteichoic acid acyltransferase DltB (MBOAT superfamily)
MLFNSLQFLIFFVLVYGAYRLLPHRAQNWLLLGASYYFYAAWNWRFLGLLVGSTLVDYGCAIAIAKSDDARRRTLLVTLSLAFNLTMLGFFKYFNFFADSLHGLFAAIGWRLDVVTLHVILPIGISFYTFMTMSYVIDVYRREIPPTRHLLDFALFVGYFPHLVAGPILRASKLLPQIERPRTIRREQITEGLWLIGWGFFKKMFVADNLGHLVDGVFASGAGTPLTGPAVVLATYAFAFQIYGDFSGYTDIARGTSKLMGIDLNINFLFPYFVTSPQAFWRHWHISLSTWLRDYLYIPLGGSRGSAWKTHRNLLITMLLGGLWHGAAWPFVLWGAYQGILLIVYRWLRVPARTVLDGLRTDAGGDPVRGAYTPGGRAATVAAWFVMFQLTCLGWLIFRANDGAQIGTLLAALGTGWSWHAPAWAAYGPLLLAYVVPLLVVHAIEARQADLLAVFRLPVAARYAIYCALGFLLILFGEFGSTQFIYFQF